MRVYRSLQRVTFSDSGVNCLVAKGVKTAKLSLVKALGKNNSICNYLIVFNRG